MESGLAVIVLARIYSDARSPVKTSFLTPWARRPICKRTGSRLYQTGRKIKQLIAIKKKTASSFFLFNR